MTVNIPGINPRNIFLFFNNIKVYDWASSSGKDNRKGDIPWIMFMTYLINL